MKRWTPALCLLLLAPLVGEFLLGNLPLDSPGTLAALPALVLLYGAGAVVIRELAVRSGRGRPAVVLLAVAYGVVEEGLVTQSLFNPSYLGLQINDYGAVPGTGLGLPWVLYVLTLHTVWSIAVPVAVVESAFAGRQGTPWLGPVGLGVTVALYVLGVLLLGFATFVQEDFFASPGQLAAAALAAAAVAASVRVLPVRPVPTRPVPTGRPVPDRRAGGPVRPLVLAVAAGAVFFGLYLVGLVNRTVPAAVDVVATVLLLGAVVGAVLALARGRGWGTRHRLALASGAVLTYAWAGVVVQHLQYGHSPVSIAVQAALVAGAVAVIVVAWRRSGDVGEPVPPVGTQRSAGPRRP